MEARTKIGTCNYFTYTIFAFDINHFKNIELAKTRSVTSTLLVVEH